MQVWAGGISCGPAGNILNSTFKNAETFQFQDALGQTVLEACRVIPDGVLLFLPSYALMDKLIKRWQVSCHQRWKMLLQGCCMDF